MEGESADSLKARLPSRVSVVDIIRIQSRMLLHIWSSDNSQLNLSLEFSILVVLKRLLQSVNAHAMRE